MGELVVGKPVLQVDFRVSVPLDLVSAMSLLYRAVPGSGLDPWLVATRRSLPDELRADLDLLHGFSGRLLYYMEEPAMRFDPVRPHRAGASFADYHDFLLDLPAEAYREMAAHALGRVHRDHDRGEPFAVPAPDDEAAWRRALEPGLTTATGDEAVALVLDPAELKRRTVGLIRGIWEQVYRDEFAAREPMLNEAVRLARPIAARGFGMVFADLTGSRLPSTLIAGVGEVARATFCPSAHLGAFVSYILYPPDLIVFFGAPEWIARAGGEVDTSFGQQPSVANEQSVSNGGRDLSVEALLEGLRALADPNRLQILDLLSVRELYAQELVGRLGIAQSAVSRHLSLLERAGLVTVRPRRGMKYYRVADDRLAAIAGAIRQRAAAAAEAAPADDGDRASVPDSSAA